MNIGGIRMHELEERLAALRDERDEALVRLSRPGDGLPGRVVRRVRLPDEEVEIQALAGEGGPLSQLFTAASRAVDQEMAKTGEVAAQ